MIRVLSIVTGIIKILVGGLACFAGVWLWSVLNMEGIGDIVGFAFLFVVMEYYGLYLIISGWKQMVNQVLKRRLFIYLFLGINTFLLIGFLWAYFERGEDMPGLIAILVIALICVVFGIEEAFKLSNSCRNRN
ncbi:hypothetical protein [Marinifilum sp. D737]|uniref:hypothetical protein n=1 Tax=Marinifilum sp. D737 TaxID=2969628 RepID=UPI0022757FA6|nr:hypothetical protein [Marinifilum sp. D737]MCY1634170.1 hypothetical protein [Marinifilum sp. D737]